MPRETIDNTQTSGTDDELHLAVLWGREQVEIQVATYRDNPDGQRGDGWYVNLDRRSINRLIRVLRKARDQACGADA